MEKDTVLVHTCFQHKKGFEKDTPASPEKCRCRKRISSEKAAEEVKLGLAKYTEVKKTIEKIVVCLNCCLDGKSFKKSCKNCLGTGRVIVKEFTKIFGPDIIRTISRDGKRNITTVKVKKSPTIEAKHILRALGLYGGGQNAARERWDEYNLLTKKCFVQLLTDYINVKEFDRIWAEWIKSPDETPFPLSLRLEPKNDLTTMVGRKYDYGRSV